MKKIYLSIFTIALAFTASAQLSLTKAFNEPTLGNVNTQKGYDSTTVVPKTTGTSQTWNFSSLVSNTITEVTTYTTPASTPSAALFPTATIVEDDATGQWNYWRATATQFELLGFADNAGSAVQFTNSAIAAVWPINFGYSNTDVFAGTATISLSGTVNGTINTTGSGSGTVMLPGSLTFTNCLQVKMVNNMRIVLGSFPISFTVDVLSQGYTYYSGTQKFPILDITYEKQTVTSGSTPTITNSFSARINNAVLTGINDASIELTNLNVYPNPATDAVTIYLSNDKTENVSVVITNNLGQVVKSVELGNSNEIKHSMNTSDLASGIYHVKTSIGDRSTTKKLIIQ